MMVRRIVCSKKSEATSEYMLYVKKECSGSKGIVSFHDAIFLFHGCSQLRAHTFSNLYPAPSGSCMKLKMIASFHEFFLVSRNFF